MSITYDVSRGQLLAAIGLAILAMNAGCAWFSNEGYRTSRAYNLGERGNETYDVSPTVCSEYDGSGKCKSNDALPGSIGIAKMVNDNLTAAYQLRMRALLCAWSGDDEDSRKQFCDLPRTKDKRPGSNSTDQDLSTKRAQKHTVSPMNEIPHNLAESIAPDENVAHPQTTERDPHGQSSDLGITSTAGQKEASFGHKIAPQMPPGTSIGDPFRDTSSPGGGSLYNYNLTNFWPKDTLTALIPSNQTQTASDSSLKMAREMNSLLGQVVLRDLITEPSYHSLLPTKREIKLACAPPPEQTIITSAASMLAEVTGKGGVKGTIDARLAESVTKLFEQSERTVFLQYAMFRLCEMGINSGGEFRNVLPIVLQGLVRQSAELSLEASVELERAKAAQAEADRAESLLAIKRLECIEKRLTPETKDQEDKVLKICSGSGMAINATPQDPKKPADPQKP